jgi:DNA-binding winged helix-turn-helix (wHTH) protein
MKCPDVPTCVVRFGVFEFDLQSGELRKRGLKIKLERQATKVLSLLLERPGQICRREDLQHQLWADNVFVDFDRGLYKAIHMVRRALGDSAISPRYIETVEDEGYCFIPIPQELSGPAWPTNSHRVDLAVLPFANEPADPEMEFLNKMIIKRIIDAISPTNGIAVLAYGTVQRYGHKEFDPRTVGQNLAVRAVAAGEMTRRNGEVFLHVELIDVGGGTQLWGALFKNPYSEIAECPEKLADRISDQIQCILARFFVAASFVLFGITQLVTLGTEQECMWL